MRVLVIEDDAEAAQFIAKGLRESGWTVDLAGDGTRGLTLALSGPFDALIVDRMLPEIDGLTIVETVRRTGSVTPVLILSAMDSVDNRVEGLRAGGDDYLTKPFSPKELIARINALLRRSSPELTDEPVNILDLSLDPLQHQLTIKGKLIKIGPTEFKILHLFIKNLNKVFSRNQIMDRVWGNKSEIDDRTVDVHIKRIRACLANDGYDKIIRTIRGEGYSVSEKHLS